MLTLKSQSKVSADVTVNFLFIFFFSEKIPVTLAAANSYEMLGLSVFDLITALCT